MHTAILWLVLGLDPGGGAPPPPASPPAHEAPYLFAIGRMAAAEGDFRQALGDYAAAVELAGDEPYLRVEYARLLARLGHLSRSARQRSERFGLAAEQLAAAQASPRADPEALLEVGLVYLEIAEGRPETLERALDVLEQVRARRPEDPEVLIPLGQIYRNRGDQAAAVDAFRTAVRSAPGNRWAVGLLERALAELSRQRMGSGRSEEAEALLAEILSLDAENREARSALAELQSRRGAHAEAAATLAGLTGEDGGPDLRPRMIWELYQAGSVAEAREQLAALIEEDPSHSAVAGAIARELLREGRGAEASEMLESLLARFEDEPGRLSPGLRLELAEVRAAAGEWERVEALLDPLRRHPEAETRAPTWRLVLGEALVQLGRGEEALGLLPERVGEAVAAGAAARALVAKRAEVLFHLDRQDDAQAVLDGLTADGEDGSLRQAARVLQIVERFEDAIPLLERLVEAEAGEESIRDLYLLGAAYERTGRHPQAEETFRRLLAQEPDFAPALNYLGYMWAEKGENLDEALSLVHRAVQLEPDNGAYADSLGWAHFQLGQYDEARVHLERASRLLPDDPVIFEHLGDLYLALGLRDRAVEVYRRSLSFGDENARTVRRKLESLGAAPDGP